MMRKARRPPPPAPVPSETPDGRARTAWWQAALLVACASALYTPSLADPFTFDDSVAILSNASIREWPPWAALAPPANTPVAGRPIVNLTFALNYAAGGLEVEGYRIANIGLHILNALLVLGIVRRTLRSPVLVDRVGRSADGVALASALIWEVHALHTEAIAYVTQRTELLMGFFYLVTLYCAVRAWNARMPGPWIAGSIAACAAGMGSKEVMATAPLIVALYDAAFAGVPIPVLWRRRRILYLGLAATWLILVGLLLPGPRSATVGFSTGELSPLGYLASQAVSLTTYLRLTLWPSPLVLHYGYPTELSVADVWPHAAVALALVAGTAWAFLRNPALGFAGVWTIVILLPTTSIIPIVTEVTAERRMYLPLVSLVVVGVMAGRWMIGRAVELVSVGGTALARRDRRARLAGAALALTAAAILGGLTRARLAEFASEVSIWQTVVDRRPENPVGHLNLGSALARAGRSEEAVAQYRQGLALRPDEADTWITHFNLGQELLRMQAPDEALPHLQYCLDRNPSHPTVHYLIGQILGGRGLAAEAVEHYRAAVAINPDFHAAQSALAASLLALDRTSEAVALYRMLLEKDPGNIELEKPLALALALDGQLEDAIAIYRRVLARTPNAPEIHLQIGHAYADLGRHTEAAESYRRALAIAPDDVEAHYHLANLLFSEGKTGDAIDHYRAALDGSPRHAEAHFNVAAALASAGRISEALDHAREAQRLLPDEPRIARLVAELER